MESVGSIVGIWLKIFHSNFFTVLHVSKSCFRATFLFLKVYNSVSGQSCILICKVCLAIYYKCCFVSFFFPRGSQNCISLVYRFCWNVSEQRVPRGARLRSVFIPNKISPSWNICSVLFCDHRSLLFISLSSKSLGSDQFLRNKPVA